MRYGTLGEDEIKTAKKDGYDIFFACNYCTSTCIDLKNDRWTGCGLQCSCQGTCVTELRQKCFGCAITAKQEFIEKFIENPNKKAFTAASQSKTLINFSINCSFLYSITIFLKQEFMPTIFKTNKAGTNLPSVGLGK